MNNGNYIIIGGACLLVGTLFFFYQQGYIIFQRPITTSTLQEENSSISTRVKAVIYYWHQHKWHDEVIQFTSSAHPAEKIRHLTNQLLITLEQEQVMSKQANLETVALTHDKKQAILSFNRNPLDKQKSTFEKLMIIESILKTIRENNIPVQEILFLVHHQPLIDHELDFSNPWSLQGFLNKK